MISTPDRTGIALGSLRVSLATGLTNAANLSTEHFPFEVREVLGGHSVLSARGTLGRTVELAPGNYTVSAIAPDGQVFTTPAVEVEPAKTAEVQLEPAPVAVAGSEPAGSDAVLLSAGPPPALTKLVGDQISKQGPSRLKDLWTMIAGPVTRLLLGQVQQKIDVGWLQEILTSQIRRLSSFKSVQDMLDALLKPTGPKACTAAISWGMFLRDMSSKSAKRITAPIFRLGPITILLVSAEDRCVEVEDDENNHLVAAVPYEEGSYAIVACFKDADSSDVRDAEGSDAKLTLRIDFYFPDSDANSLFRYMTRSDFPQASAMASAILAAYSRVSDHSANMPGKLATLFACYMLLRENRLDELHGVVDQLAQRWPKSPDAAAIRIETYARLGRHEEAVNLCRLAPSLGVPMLASGVAYLQQRMRQYIEAAGPPDGDEQADEDTFAPTPEIRRDLVSAWHTVARVGACLDLRTLVTAARVAGPYRD